MASAFFLADVITWSSRKQTAVARSSAEAEYRALASAATDLIWIQHLLIEIGINLQPTPPILWCDNQGPQALASNPMYHARTKYIEIDLHFVRDLVTANKLEFKYIPTEFQPADVLTKALLEDHFQTLR